MMQLIKLKIPLKDSAILETVQKLFLQFHARLVTVEAVDSSTALVKAYMGETVG